MPNTSQIADILFKGSLGLGDTQSGRQFFQEPIPSRYAILPNQIWADYSLIPNTALGFSSGVVQYLSGYQLTGVVGTSNSFTGILLKNTIPFNYGDGVSYNYSLSDSQGNPIPFGTNDWTIDTNGGILMFNAGVPANMPPSISFYRYTGTLGLGNYITNSQTGSFGGSSNTGILTGVFYPLSINPLNYITSSQTGGFVTTGNTGIFVTIYQTGGFGGSANTGQLTGQFYPLNSNPSGYLTTGQISGLGEVIITYDNSGSFTISSINGSITGSGIGIFGSNINISGLDITQPTLIVYGNTNQFGQIYISGNPVSTGNLTGNFYPLFSNPSGYLTTGEISGLGNVIVSYNNSGYITISQASGSINASGTTILGSNITFSGTDLTQNTLIIYGSVSGLNTGNFVTNPTWSYLNFNTGSTIWTGSQNVVEDKRILILTGSTTLSISGLYNGFIGLLQTIQSGSGFNLTLPSNTKVMNNGSGQVFLTTGISGARDFIGFEYDGINLYATIANYFS